MESSKFGTDDNIEERSFEIVPTASDHSDTDKNAGVGDIYDGNEDNVDEDDADEGIVPDGYVRLVSRDEFSFTVDLDYACASPVVETMMKTSFRESRTRILHLPDFTGRVVEVLCQYFYYIAQFNARKQSSSTDHDPQVQAIGASTSPSNLDTYVEHFSVPSDISIEVLRCAKYLEL